jgi:hypothetical protein
MILNKKNKKIEIQTLVLIAENSHSLSNQSFEMEIKLLYFTDNCLTFLVTGQLIYN